MTESQALLLLVASEIRRRVHDRRWYRQQRDLAAGRARTFEGAAYAAQGWADDARENDRRLRELVHLVRAARRMTDKAPDPMDYPKALGDTELERLADWAR